MEVIESIGGIKPKEDQLNESYGRDANDDIPIFKVLEVDLCARAILDYISIEDLVCSERVCRRWQVAVHEYMSGCRTVCVQDRYTDGRPISLEWSESRIENREISFKDASLALVCKTIEKWGSSIVKLFTYRCDEDYYQIIASNCPNLRHIGIILDGKLYSQLNLIKKVNQVEEVSLNYFYAPHVEDSELIYLFQDIICKKIEILHSGGYLTGSFLQSINSDNLKALSFINCKSLEFPILLSAINNLKNLTSLTLDIIEPRKFINVHILLKDMPLLEELSLRHHTSVTDLNTELLDTFSRLVNLKRLDMSYNDSVNDALLEALVPCKKLEYLDIRGCKMKRYERRYGTSKLTARGVAALCHKSSAVTSLHFGYLENWRYDKIFGALITDNWVIKELESLCRIGLTTEWLQAVCAASQTQKVPLKLKSGCSSTQEPQRKLTVMLFNNISNFV